MPKIQFCHSASKNKVLRGSNSSRYYGPINWILEKIKRWKPDNFPCHICKNYIPNVGFLEIFE